MPDRIPFVVDQLVAPAGRTHIDVLSTLGPHVVKESLRLVFDPENPEDNYMLFTIGEEGAVIVTASGASQGIHFPGISSDGIVSTSNLAAAALQITATLDANGENAAIFNATFNNAGASMYGLRLHVTNTASASTSRLIYTTVGGVVKFEVDLNGSALFAGPVRLPSYTVATLPSAATYVRGLIYVSDGTSNKRLAISDGTNWRWPDGAIVS